MFNFRLTLFQLVSILTSLHTLLFDRLLGSRNFGSVLASDFLQLLFFKLGHFVFVIFNIFTDLLLILGEHTPIGLKRIFFKSVTDSQLSLKKLDLGSVITLVMVVPFDSADDFLAHLFIGFKLVLVLGDEVTVHSEPLVVFDIISGHKILFFHKVQVGCDVRLRLSSDFC